MSTTSSRRGRRTRDVEKPIPSKPLLSRDWLGQPLGLWLAMLAVLGLIAALAAKLLMRGGA